MIRLILDEFIKIMSQPVIYIAFLIFHLFFAMGLQAEKDTGAELRGAAYQRYGGEVTTEKSKWAWQFKQKWNAMSKEERSLPEHRYVHFVARHVLEIRDIQQGIEQMGVSVPTHAINTDGWRLLHQSIERYGYVFIGGLLVLGLARSFSQEHSSRMYVLINCSDYGRRRMTAAKIFAAIIYATVVVAICSIPPIIGYYLIYGLAHGDISLINMLYTDLGERVDVSLWGYYMMQQGNALIGSIAFACLILLMSAWTRNTLLAAFISGIIFMQPIVFELIGQMPEIAHRISAYINYQELIVNRFYSLYTESWFGFEVMAPISMVLNAALYILITLIILCFVMRWRWTKRS